MLNEKSKKKILDKIAEKQEEIRNGHNIEAASKEIDKLEDKLDRKTDKEVK